MNRTMIGLLLMSGLAVVPMVILFAVGDLVAAVVTFAIWLTGAILIIWGAKI